MSMLDSFFSKGFKGAKCKTLLKLTIPRIKLLRNRREIQIKQMRRDIAKLLETGQEATARIRVEHIVREENMMAAQEILELFCELIAVRLPIIETQRECPIDLKEAISSVCFAAPRCADLPELLQVQMLFAAKYGKEFISAATELMPNCGVNRQLIELLSVRPPSPEKKMKLLKEIAEEHELDWDPAATEEVFFKPHEDLLNGPTQFVSGSKLPLPDEKHAETVNSAPVETQDEQPDSDIGFDTLDFPEVPKVAPRPNSSTASASETNPSVPDVTQPEIDDEPPRPSGARENLSQEQHVEPEITMLNNSVGAKEDRQFVPFISAPSLSSASFSAGESNSPPPPRISRTKSDTNFDLQDVISAAQSAAETAERAAAAARSAASLAQLRISELTQKKNDEVPESGIENPFHSDGLDQSVTTGKHHHINHQTSFNNRDSTVTSPPTTQIDDPSKSELSGMPSHGDLKFSVDSSSSGVHVYEQEQIRHPPQRLASMDDDPYFSYPNLFTSQNSNLGSGSHNSRSTQGQ